MGDRLCAVPERWDHVSNIGFDVALNHRLKPSTNCDSSILSCSQCPVHQCCHHWRTFISSCIGTWGFIHTELHSYVNPRVPYQCHVDHTSCWNDGTTNNLWEYLLKDTYTVLSSAPIICRSVCVQCQCKWNEQNCQLCLQCVR